MKAIFLLLLVLISCFACTLNAEQEQALARDISKYFEARNNGDALMYLSFTHPSVVKHYQLLGNEKIRERFQRDDYKWQSFMQKDIVQKDELYQVKMEVRMGDYYNEIDSTVMLYATSRENGLNWLFIEEQDYFQDYFPEKERLFSE
jgi:hypothetical protein